jgi:hypothetical protein
MAETRLITFQTYRSICGGKSGRDCNWNDCSCRQTNCSAWKRLRKAAREICIEVDGKCQMSGKECSPKNCISKNHRIPTKGGIRP